MALTVNGHPIPDAAIQFELDRLVRFYAEHMAAEQIRAQMDALRARARQQAIGARLLLDEAAALDIRVPEEDVDERIGAMIEQAGGRDAFEALLARQGYTEEAVRSSIVNGRRVDQLVDRITAGVADPGEDDIRAHFEAHGAEYARPERAQVRHILVTPSSDSKADRATAESRLEAIRARITDGADFGDEAAAHSECPSGRKTGGSLGWFARGMMVPAFDEAVFAMEAGTLSEIVETPLGFHLIEKTGAEPAGPAEFEDARDRIREFLRHVRRGEVIAAHVRDLMGQARIEDTAE
jgi:peptidyl-prolyl cis-trans isomerase C